jgi:predicted transcriptional regulator
MRDRKNIVYVQVPHEMKRTLRRLAFEWEMPQSEIVHTAIEQYLASQAILLEEKK